MGYQKISNLLSNMPDKVPRFMINLEEHTILISKSGLKHQC